MHKSFIAIELFIMHPSAWASLQVYPASGCIIIYNSNKFGLFRVSQRSHMRERGDFLSRLSFILGYQFLTCTWLQMSLTHWKLKGYSSKIATFLPHFAKVSLNYFIISLSLVISVGNSYWSKRLLSSKLFFPWRVRVFLFYTVSLECYAWKKQLLLLLFTEKWKPSLSAISLSSSQLPGSKRGLSLFFVSAYELDQWTWASFLLSHWMRGIVCGGWGGCVL